MAVDVPLRWAWLVALVSMTAVTNVVYYVWLRRHRDDRWSPTVPTILMSVDLLTLTAMLHLSGGVDNPFSAFFFVNLAVGAVAIPGRWIWSLTATAIGGYAFLLLFSEPLPIFGGASTMVAPSSLTVARIVAFAACSTVVTYYVTRTAGQARRRHEQLMRLQEKEETGRRLRGLTTLAAGAAHELATPLSTIDVVVRELSRHLEPCEKPASVDNDLRLIDQELERCRTILGRMRGAAGDAAAERFRQTSVGELIDASLEGVRQPDRIEVIDDGELEQTPLWVPTETVAQAIRNLIHNGLEASEPPTRVQLDVAVDDRWVRFRVRDRGHGMSPEELDRVSEPFYTTKPPGRGMGLGLFLTRNVVSQLGGDLRFDSAAGGTTAVIRLPRQRHALPTEHAGQSADHEVT